MQKTTLKSLEKLMEKLFMEVRADFAKGMGGLSNDMRELKEELMIQKNRVVELEKSVKFISGGFDKLEKENKAMKSQIEVLKSDNVKLPEIASKVKEGGELSQKVNQMDNFLRRSNAEIQGIPVSENENLESLVMNTLKIVDPRK